MIVGTVSMALVVGSKLLLCWLPWHFWGKLRLTRAEDALLALLQPFELVEA